MNYKNILEKLPYSSPFLFVDELLKVNEKSAEGLYTFPVDSFFYKGHFKNNPVTPGVILTECMAQIGVVCLGIFLLENEKNDSQNIKLALSSSEIDFYLPVFPGETVKVVSEKLFYRFNKLKCEVRMYDKTDKLICRGKIAGMIKNESV
ncbi:3-hydroxyacyl-ACP dehydratase FabZ family protein [Salegentibacter salegens]|uniref:3-hydroxyacyl-[acyl-carrier-protein] dehydratase n=1 Tax=Salegentibacter salegens TaxID=143223 RepID=A0A1M7J7V7_9FLAO|nr:FabA/FabZ family ACP-dehydratase [Salegentibacter salegens]PRX47324.1 3-hydroxyacyl-[acyl-carrier-protein] dehydratase [Salegentibacter salegens]SHM49074.1 3-hydroxyacyl-[acyl-carrier-protein] dehydratase [Salegentibacter salegens]